MRLARYGLRPYRPLQHRWQPAACSKQASAALRLHGFRERTFSTSVIRQKTVQNFGAARGNYVFRPTESQEETADDILNRARAYNIQTISQLAFESNVVVEGKSGKHVHATRLVDRPPYKTDFYLWTILLDYQRLKLGEKGIRVIWRALQERSISDLPYVGYQGDRFWSAFISAGTRNHAFLEEVIRLELKKGCQRPRFFLEVVGALLESKSPQAAKGFARMLQVAHRPDKEELFDLFVRASASKSQGSLQIFCDIYSAMSPAGLYSKVVNYLCTQGRTSDAWMMHRFLLSHEDIPQSFEDIQPLVLDLADNHMRIETLLHELAKAGISMEAQARSFYSQARSLQLGFASENLNIVSSNTLGMRSRTISDDFAARAFLTISFSFESILSGLRFFGLKNVGPASVRAIGLTADSSQELVKRFAKLAENDVDIGAARFTRVVKKLAEQGDDTLLRDVLHSDQHADVFEDLRLQRQLLLKYYEDKDWSNVKRTIAILTADSHGHAANEQSANLLLQAALTTRKWDHVRSIMADMKRDKLGYSQVSIARMYRTVMPARAPSEIPTAKADLDDLEFLLSMWLQVLRSGSRIPVDRWREPLRRLGMCGRLDQLELVLIQLIQLYGSGNRSQNVIHARGDVAEDVDQLLSRDLQAAIVAWGFIHTKHLKPVLSAPFRTWQRYPWLRGVLFLRHLKDKHECDINVGVVRRACLVRLRQLFNFRTESILVRNRRSRVRNEIPLMTYAKALDIAWTEPLFRNKDWLLKAVTTHASLTSRQERRVQLRKQFGSNEGKESAAPQPTTAVEVGNRQAREATMADNIVLPGGPLSQSYWWPGQ